MLSDKGRIQNDVHYFLNYLCLCVFSSACVCLYVYVCVGNKPKF